MCLFRSVLFCITKLNGTKPWFFIRHSDKSSCTMMKLFIVHSIFYKAVFALSLVCYIVQLTAVYNLNLKILS